MNVCRIRPSGWCGAEATEVNYYTSVCAGWCEGSYKLSDSCSLWNAVGAPALVHSRGSRQLISALYNYNWSTQFIKLYCGRSAKACKELKELLELQNYSHQWMQILPVFIALTLTVPENACLLDTQYLLADFPAEVPNPTFVSVALFVEIM